MSGSVLKDHVFTENLNRQIHWKLFNSILQQGDKSNTTAWSVALGASLQQIIFWTILHSHCAVDSFVSIWLVWTLICSLQGTRASSFPVGIAQAYPVDLQFSAGSVNLLLYFLCITESTWGGEKTDKCSQFCVIFATHWQIWTTWTKPQLGQLWQTILKQWHHDQTWLTPVCCVEYVARECIINIRTKKQKANFDI